MKIINFSFLVAVGLFVIGGMVFQSTAPRNCATILQGDNVFVLTGDDRRIPFARRMTRNVPDVRLHIIGAGAPATVRRPNVRIESDSKSTYQNAKAIRKIATDGAMDRIVLVTSVDHFNRAKYLIERELPDIEIAECAVPIRYLPKSRQLRRWGLEYVKYIGTLLGWREN